MATIEKLRDLLEKGTARVYWFEADQTSTERAAMMATIPEMAQKLARTIMVENVLEPLEYLREPWYSNIPLLWFMATEDEIEDVNDEARKHSADWRLILHENKDSMLCDFNGWPGDNEDGGGIYFEKTSGLTTHVFDNGDSSLSVPKNHYPTIALQKIIRKYEKKRQSLGRSDDEDDADEGDADEGDADEGDEGEGNTDKGNDSVNKSMDKIENGEGDDVVLDNLVMTMNSSGAP
jgi:hypothetical protein